MTAVMTKVIKRRTAANRALPREQLRDRIFAAAIDLFRRQGYATSTTDEIVKLAGVAKGTFFNFFPLKSGILLEHYQTLDREFGRAMELLPPRNPRATLVRFFGDAERLMRREGALMDDIVREVTVDATLRAANSTSGKRDRTRWSEYVASCQANGEISEGVGAEVVGAMIADLWSGSVQEWIREGKNFSLKSRLDAKLRVLFLGLEPRRRKGRGART